MRTHRAGKWKAIPTKCQGGSGRQDGKSNAARLFGGYGELPGAYMELSSKVPDNLSNPRQNIFFSRWSKARLSYYTLQMHPDHHHYFSWKSFASYGISLPWYISLTARDYQYSDFNEVIDSAPTKLMFKQFSTFFHEPLFRNSTISTTPLTSRIGIYNSLHEPFGWFF